MRATGGSHYRAFPERCVPPAARLLESRIVPPGVLTNDDVKPYFFDGEQDGVGKTSKPWPPEKEAALRKIMLEGWSPITPEMGVT